MLSALDSTTTSSEQQMGATSPEVKTPSVGETIHVTDLTKEIHADKPVRFTYEATTLGVSDSIEVKILSANTKITVRDRTPPTPPSSDTSMEIEESGPYDLRNYDETKFERGQRFYFEGDHIRGEADSVVFTNPFLKDYVRELFDDDDDVNQYLWDEPAMMEVGDLIGPLTTFEEEIHKRSGVERKALRELVTYIRRRNAATIRLIEDLKTDMRVSFAALDKVFSAGSKVVYVSDGVLHGAVVHKIRLERTIFSKWYTITLRYIGTDGKKFHQEFETVEVSFFGGTKPFKSLSLQPLVEDSLIWKELRDRGEKFLLHAHGHHYLTYEGAGWDTSRYRRRIRASGRVMIDAVSFDFMNPNFQSAQRASGEHSFSAVQPKDVVTCSPVLRGFSFSAKQWVTLEVAKLDAIVFDDNAFDGLVLEADTKDTIESLVTSFDSTSNLDLIATKSEGLILNLAGPPGVGKTLTCEAVAEKLHLPLYSVTVGELGTELKDLETNLRNLLEIAARWQAITLIDEADIFMQQRTDMDVVRNGFVGIFLRLLEYHRGILFLTTNRVEAFDVAFKSRISLSVMYPELDHAARRQIWNIFLGRAGVPHELDVEELVHYDMNGREIRSLIRLVLALALKDGSGVMKKEHLAKVLKVQQNRFIE
ncbi:P-loop containing nucleoside triphosphate hydrolase protein [Fimicolochytrium jonesii]|uniref:P-loop containing nucleoside triphosphate hydrolase protein n=1 Tax=Fimicolochytrium jonesii TaxID=1396493 RepID=UPI0022FE45B3|nr:P-loop containing nucleoside triphosphate hydrolase protein [Fimicolochytrium jonesii]KAI8817829.1 P-loop containing nucleoside triphosphate hydrolase protein [Fimicolochytrium jonesii]